jgi:GntR family transcriptional repressor for pyruvate dehydrogenase complex
MYIDRALEDLKMKHSISEEYSKADMYFHYRIAQASQNSMITRLLQTFAIHIHELIHRASQQDFLEDAEGIRVLNDHISIYQAIKNQDEKEARLRMKNHLEWSKFKYLKV